MGNAKPDEAELRKRLTPEQYHVTQEKGTERAFTGPFTYNKDKGPTAASFAVRSCSTPSKSTTRVRAGRASGYHSPAIVCVRTPTTPTAWCARR